jgi:hypothetical protein
MNGHRLKHTHKHKHKRKHKHKHKHKHKNKHKHKHKQATYSRSVERLATLCDTLPTDQSDHNDGRSQLSFSGWSAW